MPRPSFKRLLIWCPGGGQIEKVFSEKEKKITVYGTSTRYGQADHKKSKVILDIDYFGHEIVVKD